MRQLIINADDFGLTLGVNRAIAEGHRRGVITSATLMANSTAFDDAVRIARECPGLSVGCHVVLIDGSPLRPPHEVSSLLKTRTHFDTSLAGFAIRAVLGHLDEHQVEVEAVAQIRHLQRAGVAVSHLDTHKHTHMFPAILRPLLRAAKTCGIRAIRNPFEPIGVGLLLRHSALWKRWSQVSLLGSLKRAFYRAVENAKLVTTRGTAGVAATGALRLEIFQDCVRRLSDGTWEFVCHPGYNDNDLATIHTRLRASREQELKVLTDPALRQWLQGQGFKLANYSEIE